MTQKKKEPEADKQPAAEIGIPPDNWKSGNVHKRTLWIIGSLDRLEKTGRLEVGYGKEVPTMTHDAVVSALKPLLVEAGVLLVMSPSKHKHELCDVRRKSGDIVSEHYHEVEMVGYLVNVDEPEDRIEIRAFGTGLDAGDKGCGKSMTYGKKYFLLNFFLAETGAEVEVDHGENPASVRPSRRSANGGSGGQDRPAEKPECVLNLNAIPGLTDDIPHEAWQEVASNWHDGFRINEKQQGLLHVTATKDGGYTNADLKQMLGHHLGLQSSSQIPADWKGQNKEPFQKILKILKAFPKQQAEGEAPSQQTIGEERELGAD